MHMATTKNVAPKRMARPAMMSTKCSISIAIGVFSFSTPEARDAMRPMMVRSPVFTTSPCAVPAVGTRGRLRAGLAAAGACTECELKRGAVMEGSGGSVTLEGDSKSGS